MADGPPLVPGASGTQFYSPQYTLTDGATVAVNWDNGNSQKVTLGGNRTLTFANPQAGAEYVLEIIQDGTGSRTVTWPTITWVGGDVEPTLDTAAGAIDIIHLTYDGTVYVGRRPADTPLASGLQYWTADYTLTDGATVAINWNNGNKQTVTLGGNRTFTFASPKAGAEYILEIIQDGTGGRTLTWPTVTWFDGFAPILDTAAGAIDIVNLTYDGSVYVGRHQPKISFTRDIYYKRGVAACGLTPGTLGIGCLFEDFDHVAGATAIPAGWVASAVGTGGTNSQPAGTKGGVIQYYTGADAASLLTTITYAPIIANIATDRWYFAVRMKTTTTVDAQSIHMAGLLNIAGNATVLIGFDGQLQAANYCIQYDGVVNGTGLSLATAPDTSAHTFEMYSQGDGKIRGKIDGGTEVNVTMASAPTDSVYPYTTVRNRTTAANQATNFDWLMYLFPRA